MVRVIIRAKTGCIMYNTYYVLYNLFASPPQDQTIVYEIIIIVTRMQRVPNTSNSSFSKRLLSNRIVMRMSLACKDVPACSDDDWPSQTADIK